MKKKLIIVLLLLAGLALLIVPLTRTKNGKTDNGKKSHVEFTFQGALAVVVGSKDVEIGIRVNSDEIKELQLIYDDTVLQTWHEPKGEFSFNYPLGSRGIGAKALSLRSKLVNGRTDVVTRIVRVLSDIKPKPYEVKIINTLPHNDSNYTQGLEFYNGVLYEGTGDEGNLGNTTLGKIDLSTGKFTQKIGLGRPYFGEGITILNDKLYQLTWRSGKCFVYDAETLNMRTEFRYNGEGWGLCNDGKVIIMSDGTERITFRDPNTFQILRTIEVYNTTTAITNINELEFIDGKIYANIWMTDGIVAIDPETGKVLEEINAQVLSRDVAPHLRTQGVLNGIAYDKENKKVYLTGKNWPRLYEVEFVKK